MVSWSVKMWKLRNQQGPNYESLYGRGQLSIFIRGIIWFIYMLDKSCHDVLRMGGRVSTVVWEWSEVKSLSHVWLFAIPWTVAQVSKYWKKSNKGMTCRIRECSSFILSHVAVQFSKHHLLKIFFYPFYILLTPLS